MTDESGRSELQDAATAAAACGKAGRPALEFPPEDHEKVEVLAAGGLAKEDIADVLGISTPTLRKYFAPELRRGAARQRAKVLTTLALAAGEGSVTAARAYLAEIDKHQVVAAAGPTKVAPVGKKETARANAAAAIAAGDKFAPRGSPRLAAVNGRKVGD